MQMAAKLSEEDKRKKNGASKKFAQSVSVYSWLQKRGKTIKKFVDIKTRRDMKEVKWIQRHACFEPRAGWHVLHVFTCLDADGGGTVDKPEILAALKVLGVKASKEEIEAMISHVDTKNTGMQTIFESSCQRLRLEWYYP